ncbi:hypothetical protein GCM10009827_030680 [Dactylosporangium maewongense]|uniref:DUF4132 domain-containing protein n=1 Tax=Dactylosporangium maewongense TaxID=634393 RepID=A0ABP4L0H1_9ACTN
MGTFGVPASWLRDILPRRGGAPAGFSPSATWAADIAALLDKRPSLRAALTNADTPADVSAEGLAHLDGDAASTPLGAAAVVAAYVGPPDQRCRAAAAVFADGWVAGRGLPFAVEAAMELQGLGYGSFGAGTTLVGQPVVRYLRGSEGAFSVLARVRAALAAAPEEVYRSLVRRLAAWRERSATHRVVAAFLAPTEASWVEEEVRGHVVGDDWRTRLTLASVTTAAQAETLVGSYPPWAMFADATLLPTIADGLGVAVVPPLVVWLDRFGSASADGRRAMLSILATMPTDEALQALVDRADKRDVPAALTEACDRFPQRAVRLLAEGASRPRIAQRLRTHVARHRAAAEEVLPALAGAAATRVAAELAALDRRVVAPPKALPPLLVTPPWVSARRTGRKPLVVPGLRCTDEPVIGWEPGEQAEWLDRAGTAGQWGPLRSDWTALARDIEAGRCAWFDKFGFFLRAPMEIAAPVAARWRPTRRWDRERWAPPLIARFGVLVLPLVLEVDRSGASPLLMPFTGPEVAAAVARGLDGGRAARQRATDWLRRHPAAAARALIPAAVGPAGSARRLAGQALRVLAGLDHRDTVETAARSYGAVASAAVIDLLDTDPLLVLPARVPALPDWADPAALTPIELRGGAGTVPPDAARHVLTMLAMSKQGEPYAGLAVVAEACTPASLAAFAVSLLERWVEAGAPPRAGWVLEAQALLGDDETARHLAAHIRAWPGEGAMARAASAVDIIARIGTEGALTHLHRLTTTVRAKPIRVRAEERLAEVAASLDLSPDQLADRLVPDLGLDAAGTLTLGYGPRRFTVGLDEQLRPFVTDGTGARRKDLPKPGTRDDPALARAAAQRFALLKKDARAVAADQVTRFEHAMVSGRRWSAAEFRRLIVDHPLVFHVARRLVWAVFPAEPSAGQAEPSGPPGSFVPGRDRALVVGGHAVSAGVVAPSRTMQAAASDATAPSRTVLSAGIGVAAADSDGSGGPVQGATVLGGGVEVAAVGLGGGGGPARGVTALGGGVEVAAAGSGGGGGPARGVVGVRVAEDRTFAGVGDESVTLADDAVVGVAHPLHLGDGVAAWAGVFADYAILQPFPQLGRGSHALAAEEVDRDALVRFVGVKAPSERFAALLRGAWRRTGSGLRDGWGSIERDLPGDRVAVVELDPGLHHADPTVDPVQAIADVCVVRRHAGHLGTERLRLADLDPIGAYELVRDLEAATA